MTMIISVEHGAMMLPVNSPVIGSARSAPFAEDGVSGPPLFPDQGLPLVKLLMLGAALTPAPPEPLPPGARKAPAKSRAMVAAPVAPVAPKDAGDPGGLDPSYDEAVEKLLWFLVVG